MSARTAAAAASAAAAARSGTDLAIRRAMAGLPQLRLAQVTTTAPLVISFPDATGQTATVQAGRLATYTPAVGDLVLWVAVSANPVVLGAVTDLPT